MRAEENQKGSEHTPLRQNMDSIDLKTSDLKTAKFAGSEYTQANNHSDSIAETYASK